MKILITFITLYFISIAAYSSEEIPKNDISLSDVPEFLDNARCIACHGMEEMRVGPPWNAISALYSTKSEEQSVDYLSHKIRFGGGGVWGITPMIKYKDISTQQAETIARWILNLQVEK